MRSRAFKLSLVLVLLAAAVAAPGEAARRPVPPAPAAGAAAAKAQGLRGPIKPIPAPDLLAPLATPAAAMSPMPGASRPALDLLASSSDCRQACGRGYYFCLAGQVPESCSPLWTRCLRTCRQGDEAP